MRSIAVPGLALALALLQAACTSPCEHRTTWVNEASGACQTCQRTRCAKDVDAIQRTPMICRIEYACVARCPARSETTCGCTDTCVQSEACSEPYRAFEACVVRACDRECNTGQ